jgi:hypothetical protein
MPFSGLTIISAERQLLQTQHSHAQRSRSCAVSFGFFADRCKTLSW